MKAFNTVLIPHEFIANAATTFAQSNFSEGHDGYCLSQKGHLPHITLAQIEVEDDFDDKAFFEKVSEIKWNADLALTLGDYYHNLDRGYNGVHIQMTPELRRLHNQVIDACKEFGVKPQNASGDDYWPHMTFAKHPVPLPEPVHLPLALTGQVSGWKLQFGYMGEHGTYLGAYKAQ